MMYYGDYSLLGIFSIFCINNQELFNELLQIDEQITLIITLMGVLILLLGVYLVIPAIVYENYRLARLPKRVFESISYSDVK